MNQSYSSWRELPPGLREEVLQLAERGDVHPDLAVVGSAFTAVSLDYQRYRLLRSVSLWAAYPVFGGIMLALVYLGFRIKDGSWWFTLLAAFSGAIVAGYDAVRQHGSLPPPIGSCVPFAVVSAFSRALGREAPMEEQPTGRNRFLTAVGIAAAALILAYVFAGALDRQADPRTGLVMVALAGLFTGVASVLSG